MGDRTSLDLIGRQDELVRALRGHSANRWLSSFSTAGRYPSTTSQNRRRRFWSAGIWDRKRARAVAEVLFGDFNPGGKLPITIPRSAGHLPAFYNHKPSARRGYLFDDVSPLFAFGFGLSYTTFAILRSRGWRRRSIRRDGSTRVVGGRDQHRRPRRRGVVQLYIRDLVSSVTRPVKELKGFERVVLQPGETRTVVFEITPELLTFWDVNMSFIVEAGEFEFMTGNSSRDCDLQKVILRVN